MFLSIYHSGYVPEPLSGPPLIDCRDSVLSPLADDEEEPCGVVWCQLMVMMAMVVAVLFVF